MSFHNNFVIFYKILFFVRKIQQYLNKNSNQDHILQHFIAFLKVPNVNIFQHPKVCMIALGNYAQIYFLQSSYFSFIVVDILTYLNLNVYLKTCNVRIVQCLLYLSSLLFFFKNYSSFWYLLKLKLLTLIGMQYHLNPNNGLINCFILCNKFQKSLYKFFYSDFFLNLQYIFEC
eukprot:TRINITY_DN972_c0_g1_i2.p1 TRINITY_DN972_c0_g1~~TRINITY_DN972_c0_g1_i2.p1  ORF type:complete len:186 (-),score=-18.14 TRINITY_DN972_c0_g1_i2:87-608(-)